MLQVGAQAPEVAGRDQYGAPFSTENALPTQALLLVFFPWVFSDICGGELRALRDALPDFSAAGVEVVGVSCDAMFSQRVWADSEQLGFRIVSDHWPHGDIARSYDVFDDQVGVALRGTFLIDQAGIVRWSIVRGIGEPRSVDEQLAAARALG